MTTDAEGASRRKKKLSPRITMKAGIARNDTGQKGKLELMLSSLTPPQIIDNGSLFPGAETWIGRRVPTYATKNADELPREVQSYNSVVGVIKTPPEKERRKGGKEGRKKEHRFREYDCSYSLSNCLDRRSALFASVVHFGLEVAK
jgi:hypothetical protein